MTTHPTVPNPTPAAQARHANWLAWLSACVAVGTLVLAGIILPAVLDSKAGLEAQEQSDEITACRSEYRVRIDLAESARFDIVAAIIIAAAENDGATALELTTDLEAAQVRVDEVIADYDRAAGMSRTRPDEFIAECRSTR